MPHVIIRRAKPPFQLSFAPILFYSGFCASPLTLRSVSYPHYISQPTIRHRPTEMDTIVVCRSGQTSRRGEEREEPMYYHRIRGQRIIRCPRICRLKARPFGYLAATASISTGLFMHNAISMEQTVKRSVKRASNTRHARQIEKRESLESI